MTSGPRKPLPDQRDRDRAATLFDRNLVVTAGAGTGKTALLIERALNLIGSGRQEIRSLAAITFTEKAAAELRQRLATGLDALQHLAAEDADPRALQGRTEAERAWRWLREEAGGSAAAIRARTLAALTDLDAASISTIHAFCAEILRRHPDEAGVDPSFVVDEGPAFSLIFDEEWERFLLDEMGSSAPREDLWERVLLLPDALGDVRAVGRALAGLGLDGVATAEGPGAFTDLIKAVASQARRQLTGILSSTSGMNPNMTTFLSGAAQLLADYAEQGPEGMAGVMTPLSLDAFLDKQGVPEPGKKLTGADPEEVRRAAKQARDLILLLARVDEERIGRIVAAAAPLAQRARARFLSAGYASFDALLQVARELLARNPAIRQALGSRFKAILVDEFQDTDPLQYEILFFLAEEGNPPATDAWSARLAPGRLFIVGDPKQSIYRFRGADMEAWRRAVDHVLSRKGEELTLSASFRSPHGIVEPVNRLFATWIAPASGEDRIYAPDYRPIISAAGEGGSSSPLVEIWSVAAEGLSEENREAEAEAIARWISGNAGGEEATGEPLKLNHVAILLRALTHAGLYAQALRRAGLPYVVEGGRGFYERSEVGDFLALLRAAHNPRDGAAVLAVMRSPVGGVDDVELARFAAAGGRIDGRGLAASPEDFPGVHRTLGLLDRIREGMRGASVEQIVLRTVRLSGLLLLHASAHEGAQRVANLRKIAWRAGEIARRGLSLEETLQFLDLEYHGEVAQGEAPLADETVNAVRILSVHKAKGLEYPVVIVPDVGRLELWRENRDAGAVLVQHAGRRSPGVRLGSGHISAARAWHALSSRRHESAEEKRVFYVACTRAKRRLILVNSQTGGGSRPWRSALAALGYEVDGALPPAGLLCDGLVVHRVLEPGVIDIAPVEAEPDPAWLRSVEEFARVSRKAAASAIPPTQRPSGAGSGDARVAEPAAQDDDAGEAGEVMGGDRPRPDAARLAGSAVHRALERWDFQDPARLRELAEEEIGHAMHLDAGRRAAADLRERARSETTAILDGFLRSALPGELAARLAAQPPGWGRGTLAGFRETPFILAGDPEAAPGEGSGSSWLGACDLIYREADGTVVVGDYKTERVKGDPAAAAGKHAQQLEIYVRALRRALGHLERPPKIRAEVIFVRLGKIVPLQTDGI